MKSRTSLLSSLLTKLTFLSLQEPFPGKSELASMSYEAVSLDTGIRLDLLH